MPTLIISDTHVNSTVSICPPVTNLDDGGTYHASAWQRQLWAGWLQMADVVKKRKGHEALTLILNGDLAEADAKDRSTQLISRNPATILSMTVETFLPFLNIADKVYVVRGTEAHAGASAHYEEQIADDIGAVKDTERGTSSFWQLRRVFDGKRFDIAHHIQGNTENAVNNLAKRVIMGCARRGEPIPDYVVRSHVHRVFDTGKTWGPLRVMTTPCWGGPTSYFYRIGAENEHPQIGMLYFGKNIEPDFLTMAIEPRKWASG